MIEANIKFNPETGDFDLQAIAHNVDAFDLEAMVCCFIQDICEAIDMDVDEFMFDLIHIKDAIEIEGKENKNGK